MKDLQLLSFEVTNKCNLSCGHAWCPSNRPERYLDRSAVPMSDDAIFRFTMAAQAVGFRGKVALHYFNEPTLDLPRCERIAGMLQTLNIGVLLWTNGTTRKIPDGVFSDVFVTDYGVRCDAQTHAVPYRPDDRIEIYDTPMTGAQRPCYRPRMIELPVDYYGDIHLCCGDWRGDVNIGNIMQDDHADLLVRWIDAMEKAEACALDVCRRCVSLTLSPCLSEKEYKVWD